MNNSRRAFFVAALIVALFANVLLWLSGPPLGKWDANQWTGAVIAVVGLTLVGALGLRLMRTDREIEQLIAQHAAE
jgi:hypothetical protein